MIFVHDTPAGWKNKRMDKCRFDILETPICQG